MYKIITLSFLSFLFLFVFEVNAQCPSGGVTFTSQTQIDNFKSQYPNCTQLNGNLSINPFPNGDNSDITNLDSLVNLTSLGGLSISRCLNLTSIEGLSNLTLVSSFLSLYRNPSLSTLNPLSNASVQQYLLIREMDGLTDLSGLNSVNQLSLYIYIFDNENLTSLNGLENITLIGSYIVIQQNPNLTNIDALMNIDPNSIDSHASNVDDLEIHDNVSLSNCALSNFCELFDLNGITYDIHDNLSPCNSQPEIEMECDNNIPPECTQLVSPLNGAYPVDISSDISWQSVDMVDGYRVNIGTTSNGGEIVNDSLLFQTTMSLDTLPYFSVIYVNITPYNQNGDAVGCTEEIFVTEEEPPLPSCSQMLFPFDGQTDVSVFTDLSWTSSQYADYYHISLGTSLGSADLYDSIFVGNSTNFSPSTLPFNQTIYFKIYPANEIGVAPNCQTYSFTTEDYPSCPYGNTITFSSQASINDFSINYPNCTFLQASLVLDGSDITSLSGLVNLESVQGDLHVKNTSLTDLTGLTNIKFILGNVPFSTNFNGLLIENNSNLNSINGADSLEWIGGAISIKNNDILTTLNGFDNIENVIADVRIIGNESLTDISGIPFGPSTDLITLSLNTNLEECAVSPICDFIDDGNTLSAFNNGATCTTSEIEIACSILPVDYSKSIKVENQDGSIIISFSTAQEINNSHFEIEHSINGRYFQSIGRIDGQGNTNKETDYYYIHEKPSSGINYYRINQVDYDGGYAYSNIASVSFDLDGEVSIYPNPVSNVLTVESGKKMKYSIKDINDRNLLNGLIEEKASIDMSALDKGVYYIQFSNGLRRKIVKI